MNVVPKNLCFLDVETTGLNVGVHDILTVGLVSPEGESLELRKQVSLSAPVEKNALEVNGIGDLQEFNKSALPSHLFCELIIQFVENFYDPSKKVIVCGRNVGFDYHMLRSVFCQAQLCKDFERVFDFNILDLHGIIAAFAWQEESIRKTHNLGKEYWPRSSTLYKSIFNLQEPKPHGAEAGALLAYQAFKTLFINDTSTIPVET